MHTSDRATLPHPRPLSRRERGVETLFPWGTLATFLILQTVGLAAPPDVKHLFPSGGAAGQTVDVAVGGSAGAVPVQVWSSRDDVKGEVSEAGKLKITIAEKAAPGTAWLRLHNAEGASSIRPFVIGSLPETNEAEPNAELKTATAVPAVPAVVNGVLEKNGDVDLFSVPLKAGQTLVADVEANRRFGSPIDAVLQLLSPTGRVLVQNNDDQGLDPRVIFTAPADGTYFVRVFGFAFVPNSSIVFAGDAAAVYRLTLATGPFVDHSYPLVVTRGTSGKVNGIGWNLSPSDTQRALTPSPSPGGRGEFVELPFDASSNAKSLTLQLPGMNNLATVGVVPHATSVEAEPNDREHANEVVFPVTVSGHIDAPRDVDVFRLRASKGQRLRVSVDARSLDSPLDPVLRITDAAGKVLQEQDDEARRVYDCELTFTAPADGEFFFAVTDRFEHGSFRHFYLLTIEPLRPDFAVTPAERSFVLTVGKPLEISVTIDREQGFAGEIELSVEGLPEGVTAMPAKSEAKGESAKKVKLTLSGMEAKPSSGPIRITGRSTGEPSLTRIATVPLTDIPTRLEYLWLTVVAPPAK